MTTISAKIIADGASPQGIRFTNVQARYPRFIHAESKTHRKLVEHASYLEEYTEPTGLMYDPALSRNARSSRAVPVERMIAEIESDPVVPLHWGKHQTGMQAYQELQAGDRDAAISAWMYGLEHALKAARRLLTVGAAKQNINRLLEPYMHIDTLVSGTDWANFMALRDHEAAEPHMRMLAVAIRDAMAASTPEALSPGEWQLPYVSGTGVEDALAMEAYAREHGLDVLHVAQQVSVARCARISYAPFDGDSTLKAEMRRAAGLVSAAPMHASPAEHQATPDESYVRSEGRSRAWRNPEHHGNLTGWRQLRKTLSGECAPEVDRWGGRP